MNAAVDLPLRTPQVWAPNWSNWRLALAPLARERWGADPEVLAAGGLDPGAGERAPQVALELSHGASARSSLAVSFSSISSSSSLIFPISKAT